MDGAPIIIPLVALVIPILFLLGAIVFDAAVISWVVYQVWRNRGHARARAFEATAASVTLTNESGVVRDQED